MFSEDSFKIKELTKQTGHHRKIKLTSNHGNGPLRSFGNRDSKIWQLGGNENVKKKTNNRFGRQNNNFALQASHFFSLPFVQVDDVTLPNYTFL